MKQKRNNGQQLWQTLHAHLSPLDRWRAAVAYTPESGVFTWISRPARRCHIGAQAGTISNGRRYITVAGNKIACARLAWWFVSGEPPKMDVDHKDGDKLNDRIDNLRDVAPIVNAQNLRGPKSNNQIGVLGVRRHRGRFEARIVVAGKEKGLGGYATSDEAARAYVDAKRLLHEGCTI